MLNGPRLSSSQMVVFQYLDNNNVELETVGGLILTIEVNTDLHIEHSHAQHQLVPP